MTEKLTDQQKEFVKEYVEKGDAKQAAAVTVKKEEVKKPAPPPKPTLKIDEGVFKVDLTPYREYIEWEPRHMGYFLTENTYKLLSYLSNQLPKGSLVADLGTFTGTSAIALATNKDVSVRSYDIERRLPYTGKICSDMSNILCIEQDCTGCVDEFVNAKLIYMDVHPHDGIQEKIVFSKLVEKKYKGILILDDILMFEGLKAFWDSITKKKLDATDYGHYSGTGVVIFDEKVLDVTMK